MLATSEPLGGGGGEEEGRSARDHGYPDETDRVRKRDTFARKSAKRAMWFARRQISTRSAIVRAVVLGLTIAICMFIVWDVVACAYDVLLGPRSIGIASDTAAWRRFHAACAEGPGTHHNADIGDVCTKAAQTTQINLYTRAIHDHFLESLMKWPGFRQAYEWEPLASVAWLILCGAFLRWIYVYPDMRAHVDEAELYNHEVNHRISTAADEHTADTSRSDGYLVDPNLFVPSPSLANNALFVPLPSASPSLYAPPSAVRRALFRSSQAAAAALSRADAV
jgi:hypothetical protein